LDAFGRQTIAAATGRTLALDTKSSAICCRNCGRGCLAESQFAKELSWHCYSQWMVGTCPPWMKT